MALFLCLLRLTNLYQTRMNSEIEFFGLFLNFYVILCSFSFFFRIDYQPIIILGIIFSKETKSKCKVFLVFLVFFCTFTARKFIAMEHYFIGGDILVTSFLGTIRRGRLDSYLLQNGFEILGQGLYKELSTNNCYKLYAKDLYEDSVRLYEVHRFSFFFFSWW